MASVPHQAATDQQQHPYAMPLGNQKEPFVQVAAIAPPSVDATGFNNIGGQTTGAVPPPPSVFPNAPLQDVKQNVPSYQPTYQPIPPQTYQPAPYNPSNPQTYQPHPQTGYQPMYQPPFQAPYQPSNQAPYQPGNHQPYQPGTQPSYQPTYQPGMQPSSQPISQATVQAGAQSSNTPTYQERAAQAIQGAWRMSRKRMAKGKDSSNTEAPAQVTQPAAPAPTNEDASQSSTTAQQPSQNNATAEAQTSNLNPSIVQSPESELPPPYPESVISTDAEKAKRPSLADKTKTSMSQFKHLDEVEYAKEIALLSPEELTQLHGKISRKLVSSSMGAAHGTVCAPFTAGISLASTGINGRRVNVNYRRKKLIEARLMEIQAEKYKLRKRDYAIPAAILGASFGLAGGAEGLFVEHLGTETAVHAATVATENAADHTSHKIHEHRHAKKGKNKVSVAEQSSSAVPTVASPAVVLHDGTVIAPPAAYQPVPYMVGSGNAAPDYFTAPVPLHQSGEVLLIGTSPLPSSAIDQETSTEPATSPPPILSPVEDFRPPPPGLPGRSATAIGIVPTMGSPQQSAANTPAIATDQTAVTTMQVPQGPFAPPADPANPGHSSTAEYLSAEAEKLKLSQSIANEPPHPSSDTKQDHWPDEKAQFTQDEELPMPVPDGFQRPSTLSPSDEKRPLFPSAPESGAVGVNPSTKHEEANVPYVPPPPSVTIAEKPPMPIYPHQPGSQVPYFAPPPTYQDAVANSSSRPPTDTKLGHPMMAAPGPMSNPQMGYGQWNPASNTYSGPSQMPPNQGLYGYAPPPSGQFGQPAPPNAGSYGQFNGPLYGQPPPSNSGPYDTKTPQQPYNIPAYNPATYSPATYTQ